MRVLFAASEAHPLSKTGGLGDVAGALPAALRAQGVDARILLPGYPRVLQQLKLRRVVRDLWMLPNHPPAILCQGRMPDGETPVYVVECPALYDRDGGPYQDASGRDWPDNAFRFAMLSRVAAWMGTSRTTLRWHPDVLHLNDWQSALAAAYLAHDRDRRARTVLSIHNIAYLGMFPSTLIHPLALAPEGFQVRGYEFHGSIGFLKAGIYHADRVTTVSPRYASEIRTARFGAGLHGILAGLGSRLTGILNGIDTETWNPATDPHLPARYDAGDLAGKGECKAAVLSEVGLPVEVDVPLLVVVSRLTHQKGIDLITPALERLAERAFRLAVLGTGDSALEASLRALARRAPGRVSFTDRFDEGLAHRLQAAADIFLMPSRFEPCGLNQMYSMRYGAVPVVHGTGGLADTVVHTTEGTLRDGSATGVVFEVADVTGLAWAVNYALDLHANPPVWRRVQQAGMRRDFGWAASARRYVEVYDEILSARGP